MAEAIGRLSGLSALLFAVLGVASPAGAVAGSVALTAPAAIVAVGSGALIPGSSVTGFAPGPVRVVVTVGSGTLSLSAASTDVSVPFGYPELGTEGAQVAVEGAEDAVNSALAELRWTPAAQGPTDLTLEAGPAGPAYAPTVWAASVLSGIVAAGPPTGFSVAPGEGSATVSWRPPLTDGGSPIIGYVVAGSPAGWCSVSAATRSCVVTDLTAGTNYRFRVAAINGAELGAWSAPSDMMTPQELVPTALPLTGPFTATAPAVRINPPAGEPPAADDETPATTAPPAEAPAPVTTAARAPVTAPVSVTTTAPVIAEPPVATDAPVSTPSDSYDTAVVVAEPATPGAPLESASVHVVFAVGVGVDVAAARFTVRGSNLAPGSTVVITTNSDTVSIGTAVADPSGSVQWDGVLPSDLADGEHTLVAEAVAADGSALERIAPFGVAGGVLVRIGESTVTTDTTVVSAPATTTAETAVVEAVAVGDVGGGGSSLPKLLLVLLVVAAGAGGVVLWRSKAARGTLKTKWSRLREKLQQPVGRH
jgi:hypothetical protein